MLKYESLDLEVVRFTSEDVIATSELLPEACDCNEEILCGDCGKVLA